MSISFCCSSLKVDEPGQPTWSADEDFDRLEHLLDPHQLWVALRCNQDHVGERIGCSVAKIRLE